MADLDSYRGREQTLVKHTILRDYLGRFAHIVGTRWKSITYVDCFSGPWNVRSDELRDSSFSIAIEELRKAQATLLGQGKSLRLRCFFLEKEPAAYQRLKQFCDAEQGIEIVTKNEELAEAIEAILSFVRSDPSTFPFIFVDPTGWTGFGMKTIRRLMELEPSEVLINFMTGHIGRFIDSPNQQTQASFEELFGDASFKSKIEELAKQDREDAMVREYMRQVRQQGDFRHVCCSIVLHPKIDRTHFHLIYATRHRKGVEVFKEVEKKAMSEMEQARAEAQQRERERGRTREMFAALDLSRSTKFEELRERNVRSARSAVEELLRGQARVPYDDAWDLVAQTPLVWDTDLKDWIKDWRRTEQLAIEGLKPRQRAPKLNQRIVLKWQSTSNDPSGSSS